MKLVIFSKEKGILDLGMIKVLFVCSHPVALLCRQVGESECWDGYLQSNCLQEVNDQIDEWFSDHAMCGEPLLVLGESTFSLLLGGLIFKQLSNDFEVLDRFGISENLDS